MDWSSVHAEETERKKLMLAALHAATNARHNKSVTGEPECAHTVVLNGMDTDALWPKTTGGKPTEPVRRF